MPTSVPSGNPFSRSTISSSRIQREADAETSDTAAASAPFQHIQHRKADARNIRNPLKTESVMRQIQNTANVAPQSKAFETAQTSAVSQFYKNKIAAVEREQFSQDSALCESRLGELEEAQKKQLQRMLLQQQKQSTAQPMYGALPSIPSKQEL